MKAKTNRTRNVSLLALAFATLAVGTAILAAPAQADFGVHVLNAGDCAAGLVRPGQPECGIGLRIYNDPLTG